jgi:hypothetical protein
MPVLRHDPPDRRARRYSSQLVARARELAAGGWSAEQIVALLERIRGRLDGLATAPLSDDDLAHLVAVDEWLAALSEGDTSEGDTDA